MSVRVRFAPSPTGYLHIGGARTAIFNYLFARHHGGTFILRIEDTDVERSKKEYTEAILNSLRWLGVEWDEGPYFQSERMNVYREYLDLLIKRGKGYQCWCTPDELTLFKDSLKKEKKKFKRSVVEENHPEWLSPREGIPPVVIVETPTEGRIYYDDLIRGTISFPAEDVEDFIIWRSNDTPTYNFVVVVDDADMKITHVIRGDDHISNTPKQIVIYRALGFELPHFAHVPMILGPDKKRLSKRHGATSVEAYREAGYLPEALFNYLVRLGWSYGDQEIFTKEELIEKFDLSGVGKSPAVFNPEKLLWLNAEYIRASDHNRLFQEIYDKLPPDQRSKLGTDPSFFKLIGLVKVRSRTLIELYENLRFYFEPYPDSYDEKGVRKFFSKKPVFDALCALYEEMDKMIHFNEENLEKAFRDVSERYNVKLRDLAQAVRLAVTGKTVSPGIFETLEILGKIRTLKKIQRAIEWIKSNVNFENQG